MLGLVQCEWLLPNRKQLVVIAVFLSLSLLYRLFVG